MRGRAASAFTICVSLAVLIVVREGVRSTSQPTRGAEALGSGNA